jgi:hypothetical protein
MMFWLRVVPVLSRVEMRMSEDRREMNPPKFREFSRGKKVKNLVFMPTISISASTSKLHSFHQSLEYSNTIVLFVA